MSSEEVRTILEEIRAQLADLQVRVRRLEGGDLGEPARQPAVAEAPPRPAISEEKVLAIAAAIAAYLGVRVKIRQIRLVSSTAWAQQGRLWVQASHHVHHE